MYSRQAAFLYKNDNFKSHVKYQPKKKKIAWKSTIVHNIE